MARSRSSHPAKATRAELQAEHDRLERPLTPPRWWMPAVARDPRLEAALRRHLERAILTR